MPTSTDSTTHSDANTELNAGSGETTPATASVATISLGGNLASKPDREIDVEAEDD